MFCIHCGTQLPEHAFFCSECGAKVAIEAGKTPASNPTPTPNPAPTAPTVFSPVTLTVSRESQFICCGVSYEVIINGTNFGNIGVGKSLSTTVTSEHVFIDIHCTTPLMTGIHLRQQLKITGAHPSVTFKLRYGGPIDALVSGAEIVNYDGRYGK